MANGKNERVIVCRSESEFEERFLPRSRERKTREKDLSEPDRFEA